MKRILVFGVMFVLFYEISFALSPEYKKEISDGCYLDAKSTLGNQRAKLQEENVPRQPMKAPLETISSYVLF